MKNILSIKIMILSISYILLLTFSSCEKKGLYSTKEEDQQEMALLKNEIDKMSNQVSCDNAGEWKFVEIGAQACGGPIGFVAYSNKIDETSFLNKVELFTQKQKAFNVKWKIISACDLLVAPKGIECVSGKPKFVY